MEFQTRKAQKIFHIPAGFRLQNGEMLHESAFLAYDTYGTLNSDKSNAILWTSCYKQRHRQLEGNIGSTQEGKRFDSSQYFVICVDMIGNGGSYSPTTENTGQFYPGGTVTFHDNAKFQQQLVHSLGVKRLALIYGFSIGAMQALEWAVQFPDQVASVVACCGSAKCNESNAEFLKTLQSDLRKDPNAVVGDNDRIQRFTQKPMEGLGNFAATYAKWIFSKDFFPAEHWRFWGLESEERFMRIWAGAWVHDWDAMEYYAVSDTWLHGDVSNNDQFKGDLKKALGSIKAKVYLMPGSTDQYFRMDEVEAESKMIPGCVFKPLISDKGHTAESQEACQPDINAAIADCLKK